MEYSVIVLRNDLTALQADLLDARRANRIATDLASKKVTSDRVSTLVKQIESIKRGISMISE